MNPKRVVVLAMLLLAIGFTAYQIAGQVLGNSEIRAAKRALAKREWRIASLHLRNYLKENPGDATALLLAAQTARRQRSFKTAVNLLRNYEEQHGADETWDLEQALLRVQRGDLADAEAHLAFCVEHPKNPAMALILEAYIEGNLTALAPALAQGQTAAGGSAAPKVARLREAVELWLRYCTNQFDEVQGLVWRSQVNALANDHAGSISDVQDALKFNPNNYQALLQLATSQTQDSPREAVTQLERLWEREPEDNQVRFVLASVYRNLGQIDEARKVLDAILASTPDQVAVLAERGKLAIDMDDPQAAVDYLQRAIKLSPNDPGLRLAVSRGLRLAGRGSEADAEHEMFKNLSDRPKVSPGSVVNE